MDSDGTRVLVLDRNETWQQRLRRGLVGHGFSVLGARSVREGKEIIEQWEPRGIVLDLALPDAHGLRLLPELRRRHPETALVVCTALGSIAAAVAAMRYGAKDFLLKPTTAEQVGASLRHALGGEQREKVPPEWTILPDPMSLDRIQWEHLQRVLLECDWNISEAARRLRLHRQSLQRKLRHMPR